MIATLPMYDPLPLRDANDRLWRGIRTALGWGPERLDRYTPAWTAWRSPRLVLAQTCSLPYRMALHGAVNVVGAPDFNLPGCAPGQYCSTLVARADDDRDARTLCTARIAVNDRHSHSGYAALWAWAEAQGVTLGPATVTGSHEASVRAVAAGTADFAAIDAHTWRLLQMFEPACARLRVVDRTAPSPALPYICARQFDPADLHFAMQDAIAALDPGTRARLGLRGIVIADVTGMLAQPTPPPLPA